MGDRKNFLYLCVPSVTEKTLEKATEELLCHMQINLQVTAWHLFSRQESCDLSSNPFHLGLIDISMLELVDDTGDSRQLDAQKIQKN